jgi:hypothetical protein
MSEISAGVGTAVAAAASGGAGATIGGWLIKRLIDRSVFDVQDGLKRTDAEQEKKIAAQDLIIAELRSEIAILKQRLEAIPETKASLKLHDGQIADIRQSLDKGHVEFSWLRREVRRLRRKVENDPNADAEDEREERENEERESERRRKLP